MLMSIEIFCQEIIKANLKSNSEKALAVLWYFDCHKTGVSKSSGFLTKILIDYHVGTPNQTSLAESIRKSKLANEVKDGFTLKAGSRSLIRGWFPDLDGAQPHIDQVNGFVQESLWKDTRGYIEEICRELNGCFYNAYYNASAVLLRRLLETLIIEAYEHLSREPEIRDGGGNYLMLSDLTERASGENGHKGLNLGRDSKRALKDARNIGNWSAHSRRYLAHASDLARLQPGLRLLVQELMHCANLAKHRK